jgi:hypothetical protein
VAALGDYLGALLSEVTNARLQADLESARIAELYAAHPLLQHMPVPRFRLPNVVLNLPVAVEKVEQPAGEKSTVAAELPALRKRVDAIIDQELSQRKPLNSTQRKALSSKLNPTFDNLKAVDAVSAFSAIKLSDEVVKVTMEAIRTATRFTVADDSSLELALRHQVGAEFLKLHGPPPQVEVLAITAQLREIAPSQTLTRIQLTISEEGVEWTQTNPDEPSSKTLMPE